MCWSSMSMSFPLGFHGILGALASRLEDCDAALLSKVSDASARFRSSTPELSELAQRLAEVVRQREERKDLETDTI